MAPKDYYAIVEGYNNKKKKEAELLRMSVWAGKANWEGSMDYQGFCNRFFPLPHDEKQEFEQLEMSSEEIEDLFKQREKYFKKDGRLSGTQHNNRS